MISYKKINAEKDRIIKTCLKCAGIGCGICFRYCSFIDQLASAEIPVDYWFRSFKDFYGEENFKKAIQNYLDNLSEQYGLGLVSCFVGHRGTGKTMGACAILKQAVINDYSILYVTMVESISKLLSSESHQFRAQVKQIDFLVIDEVDPRFFPSQGSQDLYGNHFENIIRTRAQNRLPTIICTNSEDIDQIFGGEFQASFKSLGSQFFKVFRAGGKDVRTHKEKL